MSLSNCLFKKIIKTSLSHCLLKKKKQEKSNRLKVNIRGKMKLVKKGYQTMQSVFVDI